MTEKMDRGEFFRQAFKMAVDKGMDILGNTRIVQGLESISDVGDAANTVDVKQRPPGAGYSEEEFLRKCTGCDACMSACPVHVIMIDDLERRDPMIYPEKNPCIHCPGYPCISSCPTGALDKENGTKLRLLN